MVVKMSLDTHKLSNEGRADYINRICNIKETLNISWKELAKIVNAELNLNYSESWYRKNFIKGTFNVLPEYYSETTVSSDESCEGPCEVCAELDDCLTEWSNELIQKEADLNNKQQELNLKKTEISDLVTQNNAYIRRLSREQTLKDIAHDYAQIMSERKPFSEVKKYPYFVDRAKEGILLISDWHYGMVCANSWNMYDPDICRSRVSKLLSHVINLVEVNKLKHVTILDLADLIAGRIHTQIRIESRFDVITQTMEVSEILAEFIEQLSNYCLVSFYSCLDNHSRLDPNKKESMDLESLARLIPWYLRERLADNMSVDVCDNTYGEDIITCNVLGHKIIGVHGDNDKPSTALDKLSLMTHQSYDLLCTAHLHHFSCDESYETLVVGNASLMGVDAYSAKLRLTSKPSQTFIVASESNVCESLHRIVLS